jgi:hypothetical protein
MPHKVEARRIFLTLLTDSVQQMLKLQQTMGAQFLRYHGILGSSCDESNCSLSSQFAEAMFPELGRSDSLGVMLLVRQGTLGVSCIWGPPCRPVESCKVTLSWNLLLTMR